MRPQNLREFAEDLRRKGDIRESDLADEILCLADIESDVVELYSELCGDIRIYAADFSNPDDAAKALEWIGDRSNLLEEIEKELDKDGRTGDTDDQIKAMLETLAKIRDIIGAPDTATDEDLEIAIQALVDGAQPMEYGPMKKFSALVTCLTECTVQVVADSAEEAKQKMERGEFSNVELYDGGLDMSERFHDVEIEPDSFGEDE